MKHFLGGSAIGMVLVLIFGAHPKRCTEMGDLEFYVYVGAHLFVASLFGLAAWGLLP